MDVEGSPYPHENRKQRVDRELIELLNELRVALPGVQVLFAFLLTVPISDRFDRLDGFQRDIYLATFAVTTIATTLLMAPTAYHRLRFRQGDKERMLRTGNRFAIWGLGFLAAAIGLAVLFVSDLSFERSAATVVGAVALAFIAWSWFAIPLLRKVRSDDEDGVLPDPGDAGA